MKKYRRYLALLLLLGGILSVTFLLAFSNDEDANDYVNVIPETLNVQEGDVFDLAIDSNLDLSVLNIVSSNLSTVRLEGSQLKALSGGTAFITVQTQDGRVQDQVLITVNPLVINEPVEDPSFEIIVGNDRFTFSEPITISQLDAPLREGFTFIGFSLEENGEVLEDDAVIDESLTLYSIYQAAEEETPELPVVDDEDSESEDDSDEASENPTDEDNEPTISTPSSITVTLETDQGITMSQLTVSPGSIISVEDFDTDLSEVGYFLKGETCESPFDFDTPLVTNTSIVFGETNYTSPCIELDEMATTGNLNVGETIGAFVSPSAATISYEWFISANDRDYSLLRNVTGSTLELAPDHFRQYIAVKLTGTGDYTGSLSLPLGRVGLSSQTVDSGDTGSSGGTGDIGGSGGLPENSNVIEIYDWNDFSKIQNSSNKEFILKNNLDENSAGYDDYIRGEFNNGPVYLNGSIFNGNYKTIDGFSSSEGLFSGTQDTSIINLGITNISLSGIKDTGLFGSWANNVTLSQVFVTGEIDFIGSGGGLFLYSNNSSALNMIDVFVRLDITSSSRSVGAFFGNTFGAGPLSMDNVYSASRINSTKEENTSNSIFGKVDVNDPFHISGTGVFYDSGLDSSTSPTGNAITGNITGASTLSMTSIDTFSSAGFDIGNEDSIWAIETFRNNGYPYFKWAENYVSLDQAKRTEEFISNGFIPIASVDDLIAINSTDSHTFAAGITSVELTTNGGLNKDYILVNDIDLSSIGVTDKAIIAHSGSYYEGFFEGNDYELSNLNINANSFGSYGLFGTVTGNTTIQNLTLNTFIIYSSWNTSYDSILVGQLSNGTLNINKVNISGGSISGIDNIGSLLGSAFGSNSKVFVSNSLNSSSISGRSIIGGLIGLLNEIGNITILNSINLGNVTGSGNNVGGFLGDSNASEITIQDSFNLGDILGSDKVGGIIGVLSGTSPTITISGIYSATDVTGASNVGQIIGLITPPNNPNDKKLVIGQGEVIFNSSLTPNPVGSGDELVIGEFTGLTASEFTSFDTFTLDGDWIIDPIRNDGFPFLAWAEEYMPVDRALQLMSQGYIPVASGADLQNIGSGTPHTFAEGTDYEINSEITGYLTSSYIVVNDIDLSTLGSQSGSLIPGFFDGVFDGNNYTLSDLTIDASNVSGVGLFDFIGDGSVSNLTLDNFDILGKEYVGALAGSIATLNSTGIIENITLSDSTVSGEDFAVGGLIGDITSSSAKFSNILITNTAVGGSSKITEGFAGGLVGFITSSSINIDNLKINVILSSANSEVGGIIGYSFNSDMVISSASVTGQINAEDNVGGLIGEFENGNIIIFNSYNLASVSGLNDRDSRSGGIIGSADVNNLTLSSVFNTGTISSETDDENKDAFSGGLIADLKSLGASITNSYNIGQIEGNNTDSGKVRVGGIIGDMSSTNTLVIENSYNAGNVTGSSDGDIKLGAMIGEQDGTYNLTNSYYLSGSAVSGSGTTSEFDNFVKSKLEFAQTNTFLGSGWNISDASVNTTTWSIGFNGDYTYPYLTFQGEPFSEQIPALTNDEINSINLINQGFNLIYTRADLEAVVSGEDYILMNDIDLSGSDWIPIGWDSNSSEIIPYSGIFDGNGYSINNLNIDEASKNDLGLFAQISQASILELYIINFNITGNDRIGSVAGSVEDTQLVTLTNITLTGIIDADQFVGSLIGKIDASDVSMSNIYVNSNLNLSTQSGGLVGRIQQQSNVSLDNFIQIGIITGSSIDIGGIYGIVDSSVVTISNIQTNITMQGNNTDTGGVIGRVRSSTATLENATIVSNIHGTDDTGGAFGSVESTSTVLVEKVEISGGISFNGDEKLGGLIGSFNNSTGNFDQITNSSIVDNTSGGRYIGGIFGMVSSSTVTLSSITHDALMPNINNTTYAGGIIGRIQSSSLINGMDIFAYNTGISNQTNTYRGTLIGAIAAGGGTVTFVNYSDGDSVSNNEIGDGTIN